ncbi:hypothetical protein [Sulfuricurvum sp.]|uniref:hypothetical protein n=1 Tax=Sulfuricurvum sp. TaxID=2025608 RepID=UPI002615439F|nr:hypothetical protein [Sulfuricurvum sp.]MDD4948778.1 hypothetical protein [Sulfuricurvum sp.]
MYLIVETGLFIFAFYRGRGLEALIALLIFVGTIFGLTEFGYDHSLFIHLSDILFMVALGVMGLFPKKEKRPRCPQCNELVDESKLSCVSCGYVFDVNKERSEKITDNGYIKTVVIKSPNEFESIKKSIIEQYGIKGYTTKAINKEDSLMLKNPDISNSYIVVKRNGYEVTIEVFNVIE